MYMYIPDIASQLGMKLTWAGVPLPEASGAYVPIVMFNQCNFLLFAGVAGMSLTSLSFAVSCLRSFSRIFSFSCFLMTSGIIQLVIPSG